MNTQIINEIKELSCNSREEYLEELSRIFNVKIQIARASCISSMRGLSHTHKILKDNDKYVEFSTKKNALVEVHVQYLINGEYDHSETIVKRRGKWCYEKYNSETREWYYIAC